jgi:hypothetical protein
MERPSREAIQLPAPPPDTVVIAPPPPEGTPAHVCLATGENAPVLVTAEGDTLLGPQRTSIRMLRPTVAFAGTYAGNLAWYRDGESVTFQGQRYRKTDEEDALDCGDILRVGLAGGVPAFAPISAESPYAVLWIPVRPGVWRMYLAGG